ncbi:protein disks lost [Anopheles ziemanni]|uniref:protein disks lost n=1 Tax=Anopheles coustani TaxID=139045 RepID=UPI00265B6EB5|nr:protein disks lost [Anopheles coustani]XP_058177599.1 protein disks lost [Anopheles ziemanni]
MNEAILREMIAAEIPKSNDFIEWFLHYFKKHQLRHHQRDIESFANYFIGFIRAQTEDLSRYAPPAKCDTPRKVPTAFEGESMGSLRKSSIIDGSGYAASGVSHTSTPVAKGRALGEPDTAGSREGGHLIARKLFEQHGGGPSNAGEDERQWVGATGTTPKRCPLAQGPPANGCSTPRTSLQRVAGICSTPPPPTGSDVSRGSNLMTSYTSTPIQHSGGGRGKPTAQYGASRNGSLEVSQPSPSATNGSQRCTEVSGVSDGGGGGGGGGRRSKTGSPCLGDFIVTHSMKSQKSHRRSPLTGANLSAELCGQGLASPSTQSHNSSLFQEQDFPQLSMASVTSTPKKDPIEEDQKRRVSILQRSEPSEATSTGKKVTRGRRIAPTTVSRTVSARHDFTSSSLKSENNLVSIASTEQEPTVEDPRGMLRRLKDEIRTDFEAEQAQQRRAVRAKQSLQSSFGQLEAISPLVEPPAADRPTCGNESHTDTSSRNLLVIEFAKVTQKATIDRLVAVFALLMDLNLVPNVLNELAYLINLVSTERFAPVEPPPADTDLTGVLRCPHNCVYFAAEVLYRQRMLLALLDSTSLRVVVENEQLAALQAKLNGFLGEALAQKVKLETAALQQAANSSDLVANSSITNVFYQQENDTKDHFPSVKEFGAFNKQRDSFYTILRIWESEHLSPSWEFEAKLGPKVRAMLDILQHPINMAHLAKLFSAQLIISFNFDNSASELQMVLPSIDLTKLSKLRQRLVAPSIFSTQYLFPGSQTFFRDFIVASEKHAMFIEQLKAVLIHELLQMNGSSYDIFSIADATNKNRIEYVVRPETIATMRVLAKFIGFIIARPFQYEGCRSTIVENRQIELRNTLLPLFDVKPILLRSVVDRKLVITVPWLVQYLSMLDAVTLRLRYYEELFHMLRDIYQATAMCGLSANRQLFIIPTSKFIVRSCLDWLFDQSNVPEEYFNSSESSDEPSMHVEQLAMERYGTVEHLTESSANVAPIANRKSIKPNDPTIPEVVFNPLLEAVLSAACPFLADFRVSVMPSKVEKAVSRTGRYRHITTRYSGVVTPQAATASEALPTPPLETSTANLSSKSFGQSGHNHSKSGPANVQQRLIEAFLQSQSHSVRRTVEFIVERTTSAVIKDFQMMHLLPKKKAVTDQIATVRTGNVHYVRQQIYNICSEALASVNGTWEGNVPKMLSKRISDSLDALLPAETIASVRTMCKNIALDKSLQKTNEWRQSYMSDLGTYAGEMCTDVQSEADSIMASRTQQNREQQQPAEKAASGTVGNEIGLSISANSTIVPSVLYGKLQLLVNYASCKPTLLTLDELSQLLAETLAFLDEPGHTMTPAMNRMLAYMLLQLFVLLVKSRCDLSVPELLQAAITVWKHPKMAKHCSPPLAEPEETSTLPVSPSHERSFGYPAQIEQFRQKQRQQDADYIFSHLVSNRIIRMLEENTDPSANYNSYAEFITGLLNAQLITISLLNEQFVAIFNEEWPKPTLDRVSAVINRVLHKKGHAKKPGHNVDDSQSEMFMELLSDLARDITEF